jgi:hypothetical protein
VLGSIGKIFGFGESWIKWCDSRPQRLKDKALEAADYYIEINEHKTYKGEDLEVKEQDKLKKHFRKQFNSWKDGV